MLITNQEKKKVIKEPFNILCVIYQENAAIHLDMIFTVVNKEHGCLFAICDGRKEQGSLELELNLTGIKKFKEVENILFGFCSVGVRMDLSPCGGDEPLHQQREQWNSGANLFFVFPRKKISYIYEHTLTVCESAGFKITSLKML